LFIQKLVSPLTRSFTPLTRFSMRASRLQLFLWHPLGPKQSFTPRRPLSYSLLQDLQLGFSPRLAPKLSRLLFSPLSFLISLFSSPFVVFLSLVYLILNQMSDFWAIFFFQVQVSPVLPIALRTRKVSCFDSDREVQVSLGPLSLPLNASSSSWPSGISF